MKKALVLLAALTAALVVVSSNVFALTGNPYPSGQTGVDISYPNCKAQVSGAGFGIVGVTRGLFWAQNECLKSEAGKFTNYSLYLNSGWYPASSHIDANYPKQCAPTDQLCLAYNYGWNSTDTALHYAASQGVASNTWWIDVETANSWEKDTAQNIQSLQGEYDRLKVASIANVGYYSTTYQWRTITGGWQNGTPNWYATGTRTLKQAKAYCQGNSFTGGPTYLVQWFGKIDQDYAC